MMKPPDRWSLPARRRDERQGGRGGRKDPNGLTLWSPGLSFSCMDLADSDRSLYPPTPLPATSNKIGEIEERKAA